MAREDVWSAKWCSERLLKHSDIQEATPESSNSILLSIRGMPSPVLVATMSQDRVELDSVPSEFQNPDTQFLLNIPKDAFYGGEFLMAAADVPLGVGSVGDLYTAVNERELRNYIPKEVRFIQRGLNQHTAVEMVMRLNDRTYQVQKLNGDVVKVLALNEYDLSCEALRSGIEKYGLPDFVLASNPNCRLTTDLNSLARHAGTRVLAWGQLLGALNDG
ncbi:MAG TPA: hypothetical protein VJ987_14955 [Anaerolineales bacterium]|nr:hypothetical protein [Anaerolineales bacterium]